MGTVSNPDVSSVENKIRALTLRSLISCLLPPVPSSSTSRWMAEYRAFESLPFRDTLALPSEAIGVARNTVIGLLPEVALASRVFRSIDST